MTSTPLPMSSPGSSSLPGVEAPRRGPAYGSQSAVASEHTLASYAAMDVLQRGGNAVDAAIAASAVNVVVKPHRNHFGGDAFVLIWHRQSGAVECLNAGGRASRHATLERFARGVPPRGPLSSTVPGLVDAWLQLHERHGSLSLRESFAPAVQLAGRGFPVTLQLSLAMQALLAEGTPDAVRQAFLVDGRRPYEPGETLRQERVAETLQRIAADGRDGFYGGQTGRKLAEAMRAAGGIIDEGDLERPTAHWQEPLSSDYHGHVVFEQALPSQGIILLEALNIAEAFPLAEWGPFSADSVHVMLEATKLAFADARKHAADPDFEEVPVSMLLSKEHAREQAKQIDLRHARGPDVALTASDTTSFIVADADTVVSFIQSIFFPWGSRFYIPEIGVLMNNRMRGFHVDPASPNRIAPGKRTVHTLNTFLVVRDGRLVVGGGTPGGDFQVQTNLQMIASVLDWGFDLQSAVDMPRWALSGNRLTMEGRFTLEMRQELVSRGHNVQASSSWDGSLSRSELIATNPHGGWAVASDLRGEGLALGL